MHVAGAARAQPRRTARKLLRHAAQRGDCAADDGSRPDEAVPTPSPCVDAAARLARGAPLPVARRASSNRASMRAPRASATCASGRSWRSTASRLTPQAAQALQQSELERAQRRVARKFDAAGRRRRRARAADALSRRRGFSAEVIRRVVRGADERLTRAPRSSARRSARAAGCLQHLAQRSMLHCRPSSAALHRRCARLRAALPSPQSIVLRRATPAARLPQSVNALSVRSPTLRRQPLTIVPLPDLRRHPTMKIHEYQGKEILRQLRRAGAARLSRPSPCTRRSRRRRSSAARSGS